MSGATIRIVVADDHPVVRDGVRSMLGSVPDFEVVGEAGSGPEAVAQVLASDPDVVVMDLRMPGGDGVSFCRQLHAEGDKTPFLFMTTKGQSENVIEGLSSGADDYLIKPVDLDVLEARIAALLRRRPT